MSVTELNGALRAASPRGALLCHIGQGTSRLARAAATAGVRPTDLAQADAAPPPGAGDGPLDLVAVLAGSITDLRRGIPATAGLPEAARVLVCVRSPATARRPPLPALPDAGRWTGLLDVRVRRSVGWGWTADLFFESPVSVAEVLAGVARGFLGGRRGTAPAPPAETAGPDAGLWRPGEVPLRAAGGSEPASEVLPEAGEGTGDRGAPPRRPLAEGSWERIGSPGAADLCSPLPSVGDVPPVDERVVNPVGFVRGCSSVVGRLVCREGRWVLVAGGRERWRVPDDGSVTDVDVAAVRDLRAVRVEWGRHSGPLAAVRAVAALAVAGVPVVSSGVPAWAGCLGGSLVGLMGSVSVAGLADAQVREEFSVRLRRAALGSHSVAARWRGLAVRAGVGPVPAASVSVVLCTRRPEMVGFALRQVGRQRGVDVEVVLALHGFGAGVPGVREAVEGFRASGGRLVVWEAPGEWVFGAVLNGAVARASGSLVAKMDDDDWYGPDHLSDLVWARRYSGADLVGTAAEYFYLEPLSLTVRWDTFSECFAEHVSGACLLTDRTLLEEVGGFRPLPVNEDAALLEGARAAGAAVYRAHGLGHVIRRAGRGHTWLERMGFFLRDRGTQWRGWRPSALLESDPGDAPPGEAGGPAGAPERGTPSGQSTSD
ncbi:glycosyltransferase [Nocardiopsis sp. NPDC057823]|uniref:glycosyltransferase n=2 Tax=unclassified Nocardiopsis TaxID=2649073 RepID=UPI00366E96A4